MFSVGVSLLCVLPPSHSHLPDWILRFSHQWLQQGEEFPAVYLYCDKYLLLSAVFLCVLFLPLCVCRMHACMQYLHHPDITVMVGRKTPSYHAVCACLFLFFVRFVAGPELVLKLWTWMPMLVMFTCCRLWCMLYVTGQEDEECCSIHKQVLTEDFRCVLNSFPVCPLFFSNDLYCFSAVQMENDSKSWIFKKKKNQSWMKNNAITSTCTTSVCWGRETLKLVSSVKCLALYCFECSYKLPCSSVTVAILVQLAIWK